MDKKLMRLLSRTRRRIRLQRLFEALATIGILFALFATIVLYCFKIGALSTASFTLMLAIIASLPLATILLICVRRIPLILVAKRLDLAHQFHDRINSLIEFYALKNRTAFMEAHIAQTVSRAKELSAKRAVPFRRPKDLLLFALTCLLFALIAMVRFPESSPPHIQKKQLPRIALDPEDLEEQKLFASELEQNASAHDLSEIHELALELNRLLKQLEQKKLTRKELFAKLAALEKRYFEGLSGNFEELKKRVKKMAGPLEKEKLTAELSRALKDMKLRKAKKNLQRLAETVQKLKQNEQKRLAKALQRASRKRAKDQHQKMRDALMRQKRRLQRKLKQNPKDQLARRRLKRNQRQLEHLNRKRQQLAQSQRQLERLNQKLRRAASNLLNKLSPEAMKALEEAAKAMEKFARQMDKLDMLGKAQGKLADLKELLRRLNKGGKGRKARMQRFLARAGGKKPNKGKSGKGGKRMLLLGPSGQSKMFIPLPGGGNQQQGNFPGDGIGNQSDPYLQGQGTQIKSRHKDVQVHGEEGQGPTRSEVILGASEEGFATQRYRRVYHDYTQIIEDVMRREDVPLGYKYYVKRYFQLIKPR